MKLFKWNRKKRVQHHFNSEKIFLAASQSNKHVYPFLGSRKEGLYSTEAVEKLREYGKNEIISEKNNKWFILLIKAFINPFIGILMFLAIISVVLDVILAASDEREWITVVIITTMVTLSGLLRFYQEWRSNKASEALKKMVNNKVSVFRKGSESIIDINIGELVPSDVIFLSAGDMIPADIRVTEAKDLFVSQSSLTGESDAVEKTPLLLEHPLKTGSVIELNNIALWVQMSLAVRLRLL